MRCNAMWRGSIKIGCSEWSCVVYRLWCVLKLNCITYSFTELFSKSHWQDCNLNGCCYVTLHQRRSSYPGTSQSFLACNGNRHTLRMCCWMRASLSFVIESLHCDLRHKFSWFGWASCLHSLYGCIACSCYTHSQALGEHVAWKLFSSRELPIKVIDKQLGGFKYKEMMSSHVLIFFFLLLPTHTNNSCTHVYKIMYDVC